MLYGDNAVDTTLAELTTNLYVQGRNMKKFISLFLTLIMFFAVSCAQFAEDNSDIAAKTEIGQTIESENVSQNLRLIKSDIKFTQEEAVSRIKAEYLLENGGYKPEDTVRVMIVLDGNSLIDDYNAGNSGAESVSEYVASTAGKYGITRIKTAQNRLISSLTSSGLIEKADNTLFTITNAIIADVKYKNLAAINSFGGVSHTILSDTYNKPQATNGDASAINNAVDIYETGIYDSSSVEYTGKGTSVAILDSGFDCSHKVFARQPEGEIAYTQDDISELLGDMRAASFTSDLDVMDVYYSRKIPFTYDYADKDANVFPYDSEHGTHVAGIIGGYCEEDDFKGVAIDTQLVLMKVFPDLNEGADTDDILLALEDAVILGVDAINMSLGSSCGFSTEADEENVNEIYKSINDAGISLITAGSNNYTSGFGGAQGNTSFVTNPDSGTVGSPSTYDAALSVASISGTKSRYFVANGSEVVFYKESNNINSKENDFYAELYNYLLDNGMVDEVGEEITLDYVTVPGTGSQQSYGAIDVKGKVALIKRGDNTFEEKAQLARRYGAIACIIYNNIDGDIAMSMGKSEHIPTVSISKDKGMSLAASDTGTITISGSQQAGPFISDFSSWGPTPSLGIKPEITAHGGNIKSAVPGGGYDLLSGTSMASPNLCGMTLLIRQYVKDEYEIDNWVDVMNLTNQLMMSTATIAKNEDGNPYSPRKQGAGLAALANSVNTKAYISVDGIDRTKLELGDDKNRTGVYEMVFNVVNLSGDAVSYNLGVIGMTESVSKYDTKHVAETPYMLGGGFKAEYLGGEGALSGNDVTVNAKGSVKVKVTYTLTADDKNYIESLFPYGMYVEGFVTLKANYDKGVDLNCPFLAFYGDWTEPPLFDKTYYEVESEAHDASIDYEDKIKADYYATTPYGSYYYNYLIPLGTYLYDLDTTQYDYIPASEEHIAVSNILGTIDGFAAVYAGLLRNAKEMKFSITDKVTGEVLWEYVDYNATKAYSYGGTPIPYYDYLRLRSTSIGEQGLINNRTYEFKMSGLLDYGDGGVAANKRNTFSFDFYFDDEAPVIKEVNYEKVYDKTLKKDRYYMNMTVYDNHYVMAITPIIFSNASSYTYLTKNPIPVYGEKGSDTTVRIEITDYLEDIHKNVFATSGYEFPLFDSLGFSIEDYALNSNIYLCPLPGVQGDFKFTDDGEVKGKEIDLITVGIGEVVDLTKYLATSDITVDKDKDYLKYLEWTSSNENVAEVSEGLVKAKASGRIKITVSDVYSSSILGIDKKATVYLSVRETNTAREIVTTVDDAALESLRISHFDTLFAYSRAGQNSSIGSTGSTMFTSSMTSISMYPGEKIKLFTDLDPWYAEDKYELVYTSTNPDTAMVAEDGTVTALKKGTVRITVGVGSSSRITDTISITVNSPFIIQDRTLVAYKGLGGTVEIPDDEGILYIGSYSFCLYDTDYSIELSDDDYDANKIPAANTAITKVIIPEGVEEIQKYAFYNCSSLKEVVIPESLRFIREYAFYNDESLESVDIKNTEVIGANAFFGCVKLQSIGLGKVYAIGKAAFKGCSALSGVDLRALRNSGDEIFYDCTSLKDVIFDEEGNTQLSYSMFRNTAIEELTLYGRKSGLGTKLNFDLPERCFLDCKNLKTVNLPDCDITFGDLCFYGCESLEKVVFSANTHITDIEGSTFEGTALKTFEVAAGNNEYAVGRDNRLLLSGDGKTIIFAAIYADYGNLTISGRDYDVIGKSAFIGANIKNLTIVGPIVISDYAFAKCETIETLTFENAENITIGRNAFFYNRGLTTVNNLDALSEISDYAFSYTTALERVSIGEGVKVGEGSFYNSGIEYAEIGSGAELGVGAFENCSKLTVVRLGDNVKLEMGTFMYDSKLASINLEGVPEIPDQTFYRCSALTKLDMSSATKIGNYAFADCGAIKEVKLSANLKSIGEGAFAGISEYVYGGLFETIDLPEGLEYIGDGAFLGCKELKSVTIPSTVKTEPGKFNYVFYYCSELKDVTLNNVDVIGNYCFAGCYALKNIDLSKVKEIGEGAFYVSSQQDEMSLTSIDISGAEKIGDGAFFGRHELTGDIVADNLTEIGIAAFRETSLNSFEAKNLEILGDMAFYGNESLAEFKVSDKIKKIGARAFVDCKDLTTFKTFDGETNVDINEYAKLIDGVLYVVLESGHLQLSAVPSNYKVDDKVVTELIVADDTYRIEEYAGNANENITKIILPDSLKLIGNYAFYGYENLEAVEFKSFTAPALEDYYNSTTVLSEDAPGRNLLHNQYDLFGFELYYYTFIDLAGEREPIKMILPKNENVEGYDSLVYEVYFGKVENAERSDYVAMDKNLINFISYAEQLQKISVISYSDEALINKATIAYNATNQVATDYGYSADVWNSLVETYQKAKQDLFELKLAGASEEVRTLQEDIYNMSKKFSIDKLDELKAITARINNLAASDKVLLDLTNYNEFVASYNEYIEKINSEIYPIVDRMDKIFG